MNITVIMPMYNARRFLPQVLPPLLSALGRGEIFEFIVVDDGSTDGSAELLRTHESIRLLATPVQGGPGAARNLGVQHAQGDIVWFVDSDIILAEDCARILAQSFADESVCAVMGSYDDSPAAENFLSQYKNLIHHYYHQQGASEASTFWAGCGAIRKAAFLAVGGFDAARYRYPSIEDIELGYRLRAAGHRIVLNKNLRCKHLKEWRLANLLHTEIFRRAVPWSTLMLQRKSLTNDLNVSTRERVLAMLAGVTALVSVAALTGLLAKPAAALAFFILLAANGRMIAFFTRAKGLVFALRAFAFHQFYYLYSSASFAWAWLKHHLGPKQDIAGA
ncbi:MAG: glycosyltransferase [Steroidobacteraceae bacterium]